MQIEKLTMSIKEFEANAPSHEVIKILYQDEWLFVEEYRVENEFVLVVESDEQEYRVTGNLIVKWSIDE